MDGAPLTAGVGDPTPATPPDGAGVPDSAPLPSATATTSTNSTAAAMIAGPIQRRGPGPGGGVRGWAMLRDAGVLGVRGS